MGSSIEGFVELAAKTNYSFLEGASSSEEMVIQAGKLGYPALGVCDRNGVYGVPRAHVAAKAMKLKLVIGAEVRIGGESSAFLLCRNRQGYGNLCELLTAAHGNSEREDVKVSIDDIRSKSEDLFLLFPAWESEEVALGPLKEAFGDRCYLLASQFRDGKDRFRRERAHALGTRYAVPVVASNQPLFDLPGRKPVQDALTCIRHNCTLREAGFKLQPNRHRHLKAKTEMQKLFPEDPAWLERTLKIADECHFSLDEIRYRYPVEWIPREETADTYLEKLVWEGAARRYPGGVPPKVREQLVYELGLISELKYSDYFLTIWDIVQYARAKEILCQGRGSAANSAVCFVLAITAIDPVRMDLLFERFISRERDEPPDIDIDFEHERREEVIQYIYERYGRHRAAITAEVICFRRKSALREVAKVFEIPLSTVEKVLTVTHRESVAEFPIEKLREVAPEVSPLCLRQFFAMVKAILGFPRHLGTHVGGFVLCQEALSRNVPIEKAAMPGRTIIQWDKNDLDALGFVKVDILGLGILTAIRKSFACLKAVYDKDMTLASVPSEDPEVYRVVSRGDTVGVFQIESRAQMNMLPRLRPRNFFDLVVEISIVRPGPIQGEMVHPYLRRRSGKEAIDYPHPDLEAILKKTYGVPLFQEQIMKMAMKVAGFTPGEADELRRVMGTWRREGRSRLSRMRDRFRAGLVAKGVTEAFADRIFSQIEGFAEYGFPESHAASFAILAYVTAYLKVYYPDVFLAALLNSQPMGFYSAQSLIYDAERHGVGILPIDVNYSDWDALLEKPGQVRLGFRELRGFPERCGKAILESRKKGAFVSFHDFVGRVKEALAPVALTKRELFALAGANAFEGLGWERRSALWLIQSLSLQDSHYFSAGDDPVSLPREKGWERISLDYDAQGVSLFSHPIGFLREELEKLGVVSSREIPTLAPKKKVKVAGVVICRQMPPTASGVLFITLEDESGFVNLVIWRKVYEKYKDVLITSSFLLCDGCVERAEDGAVIHVVVDRAQPLLEAKSRKIVRSHDFR